MLSLFTGIGGMDVGFAEECIVHQDSVPEEWTVGPASTPGFVRLRRLPFEAVFQNDILPEAKRLAELNHWSHNYVLKDIRTLIEENYAFPAADVVIGGFPCQDFSHAGKRLGFDSLRGTLYQAFVEVVRRVRPKVFVAENVNGLLTMKTNPINTIVSDFTAVGYTVRHRLVKCEEHGIPQTRWRVIILGTRNDLPSEWDLDIGNERATPLSSYFAHLEEPSNATDPAQKVYSKAARLEKGQGQKAVDMLGPGPTMRAEHHGNIEFRRHGENERRLTVREAALIQTFPPDCVLTEQRLSMVGYKPIGNAVPPLLGYLVARKVQALLESSGAAVESDRCLPQDRLPESPL